jgi:hypothetical protein
MSNDPYFVFYMPYSKGQTLENHINDVTGEIIEAHEIYVSNLNKKGYKSSPMSLNVIGLEGDSLKLKTSYYSLKEERIRTMSYYYEIEDHGVVSDSEAPKALRGEHDQWLVVSARSYRVSVIGDALTHGLPKNGYYYSQVGPKTDREPRIYGQDKTYRFIQPYGSPKTKSLFSFLN